MVGFNDWDNIQYGVPCQQERSCVGCRGGDLVCVLTAELVEWHWENIPPPPAICPPDYNGDGVVDSDDLFDFLSDWASGNADYNGDGVTDSDDLFDFLADWADPDQFPGC